VRQSLLEYSAELIRAHILVTRHALLDTLYNLYGGGDAYIRRDQNFLQVVQHLIVDGRLADNCFSKPGEEAFLGLGQTPVK